MRFFSAAFVGVSALVSLAAAQSNTLFFTSVPDLVTVGQTYTIKYTAPDSSSPVTITLRKGPSTDLSTIATLTSTSTGGSYKWTPDSSLVSGPDYALQITQGSEINYSGLFPIVGGSSSSASASGSTTVTAAASLSSALSSALSAISSLNGTITGNTTVTAVSNSTITISSATLTATTVKTTTKGSNTGSGTSSPTGAAATTGAVPTGAAAANAGPFVYMLGAVAAVAYLY